MPRSAAKSQYDVHPSIRLMEHWISTLKEKSGRSVDEWVTVIRKDGPATEEARRDWLKEEHKLGTNTCWWLAERSFDRGAAEDTPEGYLQIAPIYVNAMYDGAKAGLRPIHDAIVKAGRAVAKDVKVCPCKTIVPMFRTHVFAQIKPSTRTRIDLGFALGPLLKQGKKLPVRLPARLQETGGFAKKDRITHRIPITAVAEVDAEVKKWLKTAYELDAPD